MGLAANARTCRATHPLRRRGSSLRLCDQAYRHLMLRLALAPVSLFADGTQRGRVRDAPYSGELDGILVPAPLVLPPDAPGDEGRPVCGHRSSWVRARSTAPDPWAGARSPAYTAQATTWPTGLAATRRYHQRERHLRVPRKRVEIHVINGRDGEERQDRLVRPGAWVSNQRSRAATLTPVRIEQMAAIGMRWTQEEPSPSRGMIAHILCCPSRPRRDPDPPGVRLRLYAGQQRFRGLTVALPRQGGTACSQPVLPAPSCSCVGFRATAATHSRRTPHHRRRSSRKRR